MAAHFRYNAGRVSTIVAGMLSAGRARQSPLGGIQRFHLAPRPRGLVGGGHDVGPGECRALGNGARDAGSMREPDRQPAARERVPRRHEPAPHGVAALAVEHFTLLEVALRDRHHVAAEPRRRAGRLAARPGARHRDAELQADQVPGLVHCRVVACVVGREPVLGEAALHVLAVRGEGDVDAPAQVARDRTAVAGKAGHNLYLAAVVEAAAVAARLEHAREIVCAARREGETVRSRREPGRVGDRRHLDRGLGAVEEGIEHPRVEVAALDLLRGKPVVAPHGVRRRVVVGGQVLGPLAGGRDLEARGARPVHQLADQRGLVAVRQRVDDTGFARAPGEQRTREAVRLHVHHHDVLAVRAAGERVPDAGGRAAGRVDDDLDGIGGDGAQGVVGQESRAAPPRVVQRARRVAPRRPAGAGEARAGALRVEIGDRDDVDPWRAEDLREEHGTELAGADEQDAQRLALGRAGRQHAVQIHLEAPISRSITTTIPPLPTLTGALRPSRSPGCGVGLPLFETRAPTITRSWPESFAAGVIAMESSSMTVAGSSRTCLRTTASGMRGPSTGRANMKTESAGDAFAAMAGARRTVAVMAPGPATATGLPAAGFAGKPASLRASSMPSFTSSTISASGGTTVRMRSQWTMAPLKSFLSKAALPASISALTLSGSSLSACAMRRSGSPSSRWPCAIASALA